MAHRISLVCLLAVVLATGASGAPSATEVVFQDTRGENATGPDITTVTVRSDGHELAFRFPIPTSPVVTPDMRIRIWLDADDSLETGLRFETGPTGLDHFVIVDPTRFRPDEARLYTCEGTVCSGGEGWSSVEFTYASGATFTTDARALGLTRIARLRFSVSVWVGIAIGPDGYDFTNARNDLAPDAGEEGRLVPMWTFTARPLQATTFRPAPQQPRAGGPLTLALTVVDNETGGPLANGKVACLLLVQGQRVPARARGVATCTFAVPRTSAGKRFQATVRVTAKGTTVGRTLTGRIR